MKNFLRNYKKFIVIAMFSIALTIFLSYHVANTLFGDNSLEVYSSLKNKKIYLEEEIVRLQEDNAYLQKEYFELKNLEPEE
ncbi:septum formation initiator [Poseidonibacter ostreae]|jgi:cell division protein FtsB|uniref:Septum formation initiator n=1 Tax=Poseidonibacter ostreae TaxID=2654171 RepID=A0A6L4WRW1_9BACT|nr:septum formation initiator [Poseidonibacter ostreae]KAB7886697.1 septum formation initiator [Poseidonibacter ostreae]KAB7888167.1 septum formation initiator [Poseidonibacter ostreae]KAB7892057.1 septum formation initiator [Poseidonibacter ostreae]MAC84951.1 septum formation initiator [Arcobacter sp.]|tara:strand:+ start:932 stop:1174 length:243 start_codon:yes stop_codon:yes gene_type:complete